MRHIRGILILIYAFIALIAVETGISFAASNPSNVIAMPTVQLISAINLGVYNSITTDGYYTQGDGGGGVTYINAKSTTCPSGAVTGNGGSIIFDAGGNCWYTRTFPSNILQWGAKADDTTNNVEGVSPTDNATPFTNAITACKALTFPGSATKTGCTISFPASPNGKSYATTAVLDLRDGPGINLIGQGPGVTMIKYIGSVTPNAVVSMGCLTCAAIINSGQLNEITINANGLAGMAVNVSGLAGGLLQNVHYENATAINLNVEAPAAAPSADYVSQDVKFDGVEVDQDFNSDWSGQRPTDKAFGISFNDNTASGGCSNPSTCNFDANSGTGYTRSIRHFQVNNCDINAAAVGVGIMVGYVFDNSINCAVKQSRPSTQTSSSSKAVTGSSGAAVLCVASSIYFQFGTGELQNAKVSDTLGFVPANSYITVVGTAGASPCTGSNLKVTINANLTGNVTAGTAVTDDRVTIDATLPTIVGTMTTGTPNWDDNTPSGTSQWITFPANQFVPNLRVGDTVTDLTTSSNIQTVAITGGTARNSYVVACSPTPCSVATQVKIVLPALANASDVLQFNTEHQSVSLNDTPIGAGTGNGPGQYNYFYNLQSGHGDFRVWNRYRPPMSYSYPNAGIQANNVIEHNGQQGGTKTVNEDPGAQIMVINGSGNTEGVAHIAEVHLVGVPGQDANSQTAVAKFQGTFSKGQTLPAITTGGFNNDTTPNECHWDFSLTNEACLAVNSTDGNLTMTTGANNASAKAVPILSLSECNANSTTPQYFNCSGTTGFVLIEVAAGALVSANLQKIDTITITGANALSYGDNGTNGALCNGDVTGQIKMLDATHVYMPNNKWVVTNSTCTGSGAGTGTITGGSGYTNATYTDVALTTLTGGGSGARGTIVVSGGQVTSVTITTRGTGFSSGDTLSSGSIGGGSGFVFTLNAVSMTACGTVGGVPSNPSAGSGCGGLLWDGTMSIQPVSNTGNNGGHPQFTIPSTAPLAVGSPCIANGASMASDATTATTIKTIDSATQFTTNATYSSSSGTGFTACQPTNIAVAMTNNNANASPQFGKWITQTGVTQDCSGGVGTPVKIVKTSAGFIRLQTGQQVAISGGTPSDGVNGVHPMTVVDTTHVTLQDVVCLAGGDYSKNLTVSWLDPAMHVACSGQGTRPTPATIAGLANWAIYCDATKSNTLSAIDSSGNIVRLSPFPTVTKTWDPSNIATGTQTSTTQTVTNSLVGDFVEVSSSGDILACEARGVVTTAGTVTIYLSNLTGSDKDVASQDFYISVRPRT